MPWACRRLRPTTMSRGSPRNGSESNPPYLELTLAVRTGWTGQHRVGQDTGAAKSSRRTRINRRAYRMRESCPARKPCLCTSQRMRHTDTQLVSSPPPVWFHLPACVCARLSARVRWRSFASVFRLSRLPVRAAQCCLLGLACSGSRVLEFGWIAWLVCSRAIVAAS